MTTELIRTLEAIAPTDDQALEDRALACFVVACGELALMKNTAHRDTVVGQLTLVGSKLVEAGASAVEAAEDRRVDAVEEAAKDRRMDAVEAAAENRQADQAEITPQMGMTWDQLEAVLKQEKSARETSARLSQSFPLNGRAREP